MDLTSFTNPSRALYSDRAFIMKAVFENACDYGLKKFAAHNFCLSMSEARNFSVAQACRLWGAELGRCLYLLTLPEASVSFEAYEMQAAVALWSSGAEFEASWTFDRPADLTVHTQFFRLPRGSTVTIEPYQLRISTEGATSIVDRRSIDQPEFYGSETDTAWLKLEDNIEYPIFGRDECEKQIRPAVRILEKIPEYSTWLKSSVRSALLFRNPEGHIFSTSNAAFPGIVTLGLSDPTTDAELLLHESSHQHFEILCLACPLVIRDAAPVYHPLRQMQRPLIKLLLGYHAYGVLKGYFEKIEINDAVVENRRTHVHDSFDHMEKIILDNIQGLTPAGQDFVDIIRSH